VAAVHNPAAVARTRREQQLALLVDSVLDYAIFLLDPSGRVATWNKGAARIKGYAADEIIGEHFRRFYPDDKQAIGHPEKELEIAAREGRFEEEGWRIRRDGTRFWANVVITAIHDPSGELVGFGKVTRDLTARRLSEEMLRSNAAELRAANEQLSQLNRFVSSVRDYAIFMLDPGGHITTWNAGAAHLKGYAAEEIVGRHFSTFYSDEDRARGHPEEELAIASRDGRYEEEGWRFRKDGSRFWASVTITAVRDDQGELVGFAKVTRDLTNRRRAEERIRATQQELERMNDELKRFAAVAAHDLREPLATAAGLAQLVAAREGAALSELGRRQLDLAFQSLAGMQQLIEDLLSYASLDSAGGPLVPVRLGAVLGPVIRGLDAVIAERGARVESDIPDEATVLADTSGVHMLLQNLLSNALKYGGAQDPTVSISARLQDGGWRLTVADNGAGISLEDQERIFAAFERLPQAGSVRGTGLGLAICKRVVDRAGGEMGVDSAPGDGSRFWVWLRAAAS
jgi:PAS domain S-box-containing protein